MADYVKVTPRKMYVLLQEDEPTHVSENVATLKQYSDLLLEDDRVIAIGKWNKASNCSWRLFYKRVVMEDKRMYQYIKEVEYV